ncbi:hypothetical protein [Desulfallas thermosapovorans]|uniref:Uncharacterized protein n=1 Tax=Desulfallas thermosapovorans DSM 6562 TaxID=1121431 RepID=A0A5S4ZPN7_9FIRM|nr:hypothetical protein [Desulfallas thermosapovorans]TYO94520.1 hypothetical protein LX24_02356 [Desulfallas thermosapovorans DSM 6562]
MKAVECTAGYVECTAGQHINSNLIKLRELIEETVLLDEPVDGWWSRLFKELSLIDYTAVLAIVITGYDEAKKQTRPCSHEQEGY